MGVSAVGTLPSIDIWTKDNRIMIHEGSLRILVIEMYTIAHNLLHLSKCMRDNDNQLYVKHSARFICKIETDHMVALNAFTRSILLSKTLSFRNLTSLVLKF